MIWTCVINKVEIIIRLKMLYIFIGLHNLLLLYNLYLIELYIVVNDMEVGFLICYFFFTFVSAPARVKCHSAPPVFKRGGMSLIKKLIIVLYSAHGVVTDHCSTYSHNIQHSLLMCIFWYLRVNFGIKYACWFQNYLMSILYLMLHICI